MTRRALKTAEVTKDDQLCEVRAELAMTAALVKSLRRSAGADPSPERAVKLSLYNIFARSRRERERVPLFPAARRNRRLVDCRNHGRELSVIVPRWPFGFFPRRTKAGGSNTAYPRSGPLASILRVFPAAFQGFQ